MSSLNNILNPEKREIDRLSLSYSHEDQNSTSGSRASSPASRAASPRVEPAVKRGSYPKPHPPHPDCPDTLMCLPDTDGRPQHTLPVILRCAILGSPHRRLTIRDIYAAMEEKYPYYKTAGPTWKQSVRHHLSLNRLFERQPRPVADPGFGSYWTVNLAAPPGTKRPRKRGRPEASDDKESPLLSGPPPKKRGRPRKLAASIVEPTLSVPSDLLLSSERPMRACRLSAVRTGEQDSDGDDEDEEEVDEIMETETVEAEVDTKKDMHSSDEEYESEEDMEPRRNTHPSFSAAFESQASTSSSTKLLSRASFSRPQQQHQSKLQVDRLEDEIAGLRQQLSDALASSSLVSAQLYEARAELSRLRSIHHTADTRLREEIDRRRKSESRGFIDSTVIMTFCL